MFVDVYDVKKFQRYEYMYITLYTVAGTCIVNHYGRISPAWYWESSAS